jgi:uncharacterized membrane protein
MKNSGTFIRTIIPTDSNSIATLIDFNQILAPYQEFAIENIVEHAITLEDLQVKVGLFSLLEAGWPDDITALSSESAQEAAQAKIKKEGQKVYLGIYHAYGNGPWIKKGEEILQNKNSLEQPWALMAPFFSTNETALLDEDLKIGVRVESKAQGTGGLKGNDYLSIFGSWRKTTSIRKKKDNGIEALNARIETLELALEGRLVNVAPNTLLGRNTNTGVVESISQNKFITPAQSQSAIEQAIFDLAGAAPAALNTLAELAAAFGNDPNFAGTITALIATKAALSLSLQLTNRSNATGVFDANAWVLAFFAGFKWLDGGVTNLGLPPGINTGMIIQFDPLLLYSVAGKYLVQILFSGTRLFYRIQNNGVWGSWREIATSVAV